MKETTYRRPLPEERNRWVELADRVFTGSSGPHAFTILIPKMYGLEADAGYAASCHMIAEQDGAFVSQVACLPQQWHVADRTLTGGFIGTVCVDEAHRGEGHMKRLMADQLDYMRAQGFDFSLLSGKRQRYAYYGYEPAGGRMCYGVNRDNVRHALEKTDDGGITFAEILPGSPEEKQAEAIHHGRPVWVERALPTGASFAVTGRSFFHRPYLVLKNGTPCGFLTVRGEDRLDEMVLVSSELTKAVVKAWFREHPALPEISVTLPLYADGTIRQMNSFAEEAVLRQGTQVNILRFAPFLEAFLRLKQMHSPLEDGVRGYQVDGQTFTVCVRQGSVSVYSYDHSMPETVPLTHAGALELFLSPYPSVERKGPEKNWFPLEITDEAPDAF